MRDPYFDDIPWELVTDDSGTVVGTVYTLLPEPDPKRVKTTYCGTNGETSLLQMNGRVSAYDQNK